MGPPRGRKNNFYNKKRNFHRDRRNYQPAKKAEYRHKEQFEESEVGITEFVSDLEGFSAVIKARISDFQLNEIDLEGNIAKLTDTSYPKDFFKKVEKLDYQTVAQTPIEHIPQETWEALVKLASGDSSDSITLDIGDAPKETRKEIHECVKKYFGRKLVVSTVKSQTDENSKCMEFRKFMKGDPTDERFMWPEDKGEYVHFLVNKRGLDTVEASFKISNSLHMRTSSLTYAGVKDKRGITTQWFCTRKVDPCKILNRSRNLRGMKIGNFQYKDKPLKLGDLKGNFFRIALRNVGGSDESIDKAMNHVKEKGFINYYGLQRFGNDKEVPTFEIGLCLLLGKWKEAIDLILKPKTSDDFNADNGDVALAKKCYAETRNATEAVSKIQNSQNQCIESKLLQGLMDSGENDFVNALEAVPRSVRLFYMHSVQSLTWNKMVSKRLQLFGMVPVEGDFVLDLSEDCSGEELPIDAIETGLENDTTDDTSNCEDEDGEDSGNLDDKNKEIVCKRKVKVLTKEDLPNYTIFDIVLPLPGYSISYPENMKEHYKTALDELGLSLDMPKQKVKTYNLCGDYRKFMHKVEDLSWKIMLYNDPLADLIRSDFEELKGDPEKSSVENGKYKALVMSFPLPPSCYATMLLREILKIDTSTSAQAKLNDYHEQKEKKIIIENNSEPKAEASDEVSEVASSSLLSDPTLFAEFQNSIFNAESNSLKRKNEEEALCEKKLKEDSTEGT